MLVSATVLRGLLATCVSVHYGMILAIVQEYFEKEKGII